MWPPRDVKGPRRRRRPRRRSRKPHPASNHKIALGGGVFQIKLTEERALVNRDTKDPKHTWGEGTDDTQSWLGPCGRRSIARTFPLGNAGGGMAMGTAAGWRRALADGRAAATLGLPYLLLAMPEGRSIMLFCGVGVTVYTRHTKQGCRLRAGKQNCELRAR